MILQSVRDKVLAKLTIDGPTTSHDRAALSEWLHKLADDVVTEGENYSKRFTARYIVTEKVS